jgi:hypothetical protein
VKSVLAEGTAWSRHAAGRLQAFIDAACQDMRLRGMLANDPATALREWQWEPDAVPESLPPPMSAISVRMDDATLLGPVEWCTEPDAAQLRQTQLRLLLAGAKPLGLIHGDERSLVALASWAQARGYYALLGPYQFSPQQDRHKNGYSNRTATVTAASPGSGAWRGLLISTDQQTVLLAWLCQLFGWERFLGGLLGYPSCCCRAFEEHWPRAAAGHEGDVGLMLLEESAGMHPVYKMNWAANIFARYFGREILQHFPCQWHCSGTVAMARRHLAALEHYWPADALEIRTCLASPMLAAPGHGYALFHGGRVVREHGGIRLIYDPDRVETIGMNDGLGRAIASSRQLTAGTVANWRIADRAVPGWVLDTSHPDEMAV